MILKKIRMKRINFLFRYICIGLFFFTHYLAYTRGQGAGNPQRYGEGSQAHMRAVEDQQQSANAENAEDLGSCKDKKRTASSSCSKSQAMGTVGTALMPLVNQAATIGEEDTSKVVETQGDITQITGAANAAVGAHCLSKVNSCISTCTKVGKACEACEDQGPSCPNGVTLREEGDTETVAYDPADCDLTGEAITACEDLKQMAIAALAQGGILSLVGQMMKNAADDMKDKPGEEPPEMPPGAPTTSSGGSPMSVGVSPLNQNKGPGQFAPIKTTPGGKQAEAPSEDPFGEKGEDGPPSDPFSSLGSGSSSLAGSPSSGFDGGSLGGGFPPGGGSGGNTDSNGGNGLLRGSYGGAEGFLSGGSSRRSGGRSSGGGGHSSYPGGGKKKGFNLADGKNNLGSKREISQFKSRHQSIFEIMSDLIQSFCREGQPVCE